MGTIRNRRGILYVDTKDERGRRLIRSTGLRVGQEKAARAILTALERRVEALRREEAGEAERVRLGQRRGWHLAASRPERTAITLPGAKVCGIYFVQEDFENLIKIGFAINVRSRLAGLQTGSAQELRLIGVMPGSYADELDLHQRLEWARFRGEWYWPANEVLEIADASRELDLAALAPSPDKGRKDHDVVWVHDPGSLSKVPVPSRRERPEEV